MVKGSQHRFRQGRLFSTNPLKPFEDITAVTDQRNTVLVLHLVFPKAFGKKSASEVNGQESQARGKNRAVGAEAAPEQKAGAGIPRYLCTAAPHGAQPASLSSCVTQPALERSRPQALAESAENSLYRKLLINFI